MGAFSDRTVCWVDNGLFVSFALRYAPQFKRTLYWSPWANGFPTSNSLLVGDGFEEIERVRHFWDYLDEVDLWIFPDVYYSDVQVALEEMGKRVWGARTGEDLELYREDTKSILGKLGLEVAPWKRVEGLPALRAYLKEHDDQWVKVSTTRGDFETFHAPSYKLIEPRLDELEWKLGAKKLVYPFVVEEGINEAVEIGYDGWVVDGEYPPLAQLAYEIKDLGMVGTVKPYGELPQVVRDVNAKLAPWFRKRRYRGFFASELRVRADEVPYLIDPCCRCGTPSNELLQEFFSNWPEIWWAGAEGEIVAPLQERKFGAIAMIHSAWSDRNWQAVEMPEEVRQWVKLRNHTRIEGRDYVVPTAVGLPEIGAVVGVGETLEEAVRHLAENAAQVKGYDLTIHLDAIGDAFKVIEQGEEHGIHFCEDELPEAGELEEIVEEAGE